MHAISEKGAVSVVDRRKCIGCGLCVTGCPNGIAKLEKKPQSEIVNPPLDFEACKHERISNRGLSE